MHPTADTIVVMFSNNSGRRVIGSVRPLIANHKEEMFFLAPHVHSIRRKQLHVA
jgi:hypothetical protein